MRLLKTITAFLILTLPFLIVVEVPASEFSITQNDTIKIGLLISDTKSTEAKNGAELAVRKANKKGSFSERPVKIILRSMEGPWGTGSKEAVNLIFNENVVAIVGSHDGRNSHLVEQVTTKARVVFLSAWASDPTLAQAFVPWYFSCVPNDLEQASALIEEIYNKKKISKVAIVSDIGYDSKLASNNFLKKSRSAGKSDPLQFSYDNSNPDFSNVLEQIDKSEITGIVLFGQSLSLIKLIQQMQQKKMKQNVFGSLSLLEERIYSDPEFKFFENVILVSPGYWFSQKGSVFSQDFMRYYGYQPGPVAAYAYDGMNLIIEAVRKTGNDREQIQKSLARMRYEGATGTIQFDEKGNRIWHSSLMEIKNGIPIAVEQQQKR